MKLVVTPIWQEFPRSGRTGKFPLEERGRGREGERERERERDRDQQTAFTALFGIESTRSQLPSCCCSDDQAKLSQVIYQSMKENRRDQKKGRREGRGEKEETFH
jgi:hypothetical protein